MRQGSRFKSGFSRAFRHCAGVILAGVGCLGTAMAQDPSNSLIPDYVDNFSLMQAEALVDEGRRLMAEHAYSEAEQRYRQAWQITRINEGLYSAGQMRPIEHLLDALLAQSAWDDFDHKLEYLTSLNDHVHANDPDRYVEGLVTLSNWYRAAAAALYDSRSSWYLVRAKHLNWQAVTVVERYFGPQDLRLAPLLYRITLDHYYQAISTQRRNLSSYEYLSDAKEPVDGWSLSRNETVQRSYRIGRDNLQRIRSLYAASAPESLLTDALLLVHLADWELVFEHPERAAAYYREANVRLQEAGIAADDIQRFFNRPVVLPVRQLVLEWPLWESRWEDQPVEYFAWSSAYPGAQRPEDPLDTYRSRMEALMRQRAIVQLNPGTATQALTEGGNPAHFTYVVRDLDTSESPELTASLRHRVYEELPMLKLRPRLLNGRLALHEAVTLDYVFDAPRGFGPALGSQP